MKRDLARKAALKFLLQEASAQQDQSVEASAIPQRDRGLYLELVRGVVRRRVTLRAVLGTFCSRSLRHVDPSLLAVLEIGAYQLLMLTRVPEFAAVASTMDLLPKGRRKQRGFVNGVLRGLARSREHVESWEGVSPRRVLVEGKNTAVVFDRDVFADPESDNLGYLSESHGLPRATMSLFWDQLNSDELARFLSTLNTRPQLTLRITAGDKARRAEIRNELGSEAKQRPDGLLLWTGGGDIAGAAVHQSGEVTVQGSFASRIAPFLDPQPNERILDLCGAPGGKSMHMAQIAPEAQIVVGVLNEKGASRVKENRDRLQVQNLEVEGLESADGAFPSGEFDAVLLDVPCSNSGVLNRRPFARHRLNASGQRELTELQARLLRAALRQASEQSRPIRLVYSTCSILPEENERLISSVLSEFPHFKVVREISAIAASSADDGGYAALLQQA